MNTRIDKIREIAAEEMDYWRIFMLDKVRQTRQRDKLMNEELIVCAILASATATMRNNDNV